MNTRLSRHAFRLLLAFSFCSMLVQAQNQIPQQYLSMSMSSGVLYSGWPTVPFGSLRLWDTSTGWSQINSSSGSYDWSVLDQWMSAAKNHNVDMVYTFGRTPQWASSHPSDSICNFGPGQCDPPKDLNADGTGPDQIWKDFVTAIATHSAGRIKYWELWNEPQNTFYWNGTIAQMVRMAGDARAIIKGIDPNAELLSPGTGVRFKALKWTANYLAAGGGQYADIIAAHGYVQGSCPNNPPDVTSIPSRVSGFETMLKSFGQNQKPLWITEFSWGDQVPTCFTNANLQAAFVAQSHLLYYGAGARRLYWYSWDNGARGTLWTPQGQGGVVLPAGAAFGQVSRWLTGATFTQGCSASGSIWTCELSRPGGYQGLVVWNSSKTCTTVCATSPYTFPPQYIKYRDLSGNVYSLSGSTVAIGFKPVLLENQ